MAAFTKRLNWSQLVLEGLRDFLHVLTPDRRILYASPSCKAVTGFDRSELEGRFVSAFIHPDDHETVVDALNISVSSRSAVRFIYRFRKADGEWTVLESSGHAHVSNDPSPTWLPQRQTIHQGFFVMARPYFSKNGTLFDAFLEHKVENERWLALRAGLRCEEQADEAAEGQEWEQTESDWSTMHFEARICTDNDSSAVANRVAPSQMIWIASSTGPTQPRLPRRTADGNDGPTFRRSFTQMRDALYPDHNEAQDTRTSHMYRSFKGDLGIQISMRGSNRIHSAKMQMKRTKRKQHPQTSEPYFCTHCSTMVSPEWRKGPDGPKTLCNACGCRLIKSVRLNITDRNSALVKTEEILYRKGDMIDTVVRGRL
jgi:PAS domain S-box-containing protein